MGFSCHELELKNSFQKKKKYILFQLKEELEAPGIDPGTSRMLSERSTIWATPPLLNSKGFLLISNIFKVTNFLVLIMFYKEKAM